MNPHDSACFRTESLVSAAKRYKTLGFSIIPLHGVRFPQRAKQPAIRWARYQHTPPTDQEIQEWFCEEQYAGLGLVCGRVSRLLVLDFDDAYEASEFRRLLPDLAQTLTVRSGTRGLPHYYYRLTPSQVVATQSFGKVDLRGEGAYVVAPPTAVGDACWVVENGVEILLLSDLDLRRLLTYLRSITEQRREEKPVCDAHASEFRRLGADELVGCYLEWQGLGRNRALFRVACMARDGGWLEPSVVALLASVHVRQSGEIDEPYKARYTEAVRTIGSAYSRPARRRSVAGVSVVSNALREWLLGNGLVAAARVLDGLYMVGLTAGTEFTERQVCELLGKFKIGRRSVMAALESGKDVFDMVEFGENSPLNPPVQANAASDADWLNKSCEMIRGAKRVRSAVIGRPARIYRLPDAQALAHKLGLKTTGGDILQPVDLASPKAYRLALHRLLFERRPGQYLRRWLAGRLGVSRWTTRRYERAAQVHSQPMYVSQAINWRNAQAVLPEEPEMRGVFIEDEQGNRYPALRALALKLLKAGKSLFYKRQAANFFAAQPISVGIPTLHSRYGLKPISVVVREQGEEAGVAVGGLPTSSVGIPTPHAMAKSLATPVDGYSTAQPASVGIPTPQAHTRAFWLCPNCLNYNISEQPPDVCRCGQRSEWELVSNSIWQDTERLKAWWQVRWHEHHQLRRQKTAVVAPSTNRPGRLSDSHAESYARRLLEQVANLSLATARKLIVDYGIAAVECGVRTVKSRANIHNPAGLLVSILRSEHKFFNGQPRKAAARPVAAHNDWLRNMGQSAYLAFLANADDLLLHDGDQARYALT